MMFYVDEYSIILPVYYGPAIFEERYRSRENSLSIVAYVSFGKCYRGKETSLPTIARTSSTGQGAWSRTKRAM